MSGKSKDTALESASQMPNASGTLDQPEQGTCHPGGSPKIDVSPASLDFGKLRLGGKLQKTLTITNTGDGVLTLQSITFQTNPGTSWSAPLPSQTSLKAGKSAAVTVSFEGKQAGDCGGKLEVQSNATEGTKQADLKAKVFSIKDPSPEKFLAPGADNEDYKILYTVDDPATVIEEGELQILDKEKKSVLWSRPLTEDERKNGKREIAWKGQITVKAGYPDGYLTVEFSPYTCRVVVKAAGAPEPAQVDSVIKVQPHSLKIAIGDKAHLKQALDKAVYDQIVADGGLPSDGQKRKVYLISNRFMTSLNHIDHADTTSYVAHQKLWGGGAAVPLEVTVWFKTSAAGVADSKTLAPLGLGNARVLWDFQDVPENTTGLTSMPKSFVEDALNWNKATTEPPGDNCAGSTTAAENRGGKRSDNGATRPVLLIPSGHTDADRDGSPTLTEAYPFAAARGATRRWAILAEVQKTGAAKGKCGIIFQGSRMAGDAFTVHAYLDLNRELDRTGDLPEFIKQNEPEKHSSDKTGTLEIWKELHVIAVFSKNGNNIHTHGDVVPYYEKAYIRIVDKTAGAVTAFVETDYNTVLAAAIRARPEAALNPHAINDIDHQFPGSNAGLQVHRRATFENNFLDAESTPALVTAELTANSILYPQPILADRQAAARAKLRGDALAALRNDKYSDADPTVADELYWDKCDDYAADTCAKFCENYMDTTRVPGEGIGIFVFAWSNSLWRAGMDGVRGQAFPIAVPERGGYIQFATHPFYRSTYPDGSHNMSRTVAHEIGHVCCLPHTRDEKYDPLAHDFIDRTCVMGYNYDSVRHFCGYCLLRLRGWDHTKIEPGTDADPRQNGRTPKIRVSAPTNQSSTKTNKTAEQTFTIDNDGAAPLVLGTITLEGADKTQYEIVAADDNASGRTIAPGTAKTFKLTFKPTSSGDKTVSLRIPSNDPSAPTIVTFTSKGQQPVLTVTPASLDFGDVAKDFTSPEMTLTLKNTGSPELVMEKIELVGPYAGEFEISAAAATLKLAKNASTTVKLRLKGATTQKYNRPWEKTAQLRIISNEAGSPRDIEVKGTVKFLPKVVIQNPPPGFTDTWVGKSSPSHTVTIKNTGSNGLVIEAITLATGDVGQFKLSDLPDKTKIAKDASVTFKVVHQPTAAGNHAAKIKIDSNGDGAPHWIDLRGKAVNPPVAEIPASLAFSDTKVGKESSQSLRIKNRGGAELVVSAIAGTTPEFVMKTALGAGIKVAAGSSTTLSFKFIPGSPGAKNVTLTVTSNDPTTPTTTVTVTGTGT
jgi:hypothetical protein